MIIALLLGCVWGIAACGGSDPPKVPDDKIVRYRPGMKLEPARTPRAREGTLKVSKITFNSADGKRIPALFAVPTERAPLGCLIYQGGFGTTKETSAEARQGFGNVQLATFTIDPRNVGERGSADDAAAAVLTPEGVRAMLLDTVADLRTALDYLGRRPECRRNIGFMGTSFGAMVGTLVAAQDARIKSALLTSIGATWKQTLLVRPLAAQRVPGLPKYVPAASEDPKELARAVRILGPYDFDKWIGRISPRPVLLMNGRFDPIVLPASAMDLAAATNSPRTIQYFDGGHDPFAAGPAQRANAIRAARFLVNTLNLPYPI